jgi:hypothetical protein
LSKDPANSKFNFEQNKILHKTKSWQNIINLEQGLDQNGKALNKDQSKLLSKYSINEFI